MATLGDKWVDDFLDLLIREGVIKLGLQHDRDLRNRIRASLKELVKGHNEGKAESPAEPGDYFSGGTIFVNKLEDFTYYPEFVRDHKFDKIAVNLHVGAAQDETNRVNENLFYAFAAKFRPIGIKVGAWGYLGEAHPAKDEAYFASAISGNVGADFYIANPEKGYSFIRPNGAESPANAQRSVEFCDAWVRVTPPLFPKALISYGTPEAIHYKTWQGHGWTTKYAECFNGGPVRPDAAVVQGQREGFEKTIAVVGYHQRVPIRDAILASGGSIALYVGENFGVFDYDQIRSLRS